jgi:membrane dipeptidase
MTRRDLLARSMRAGAAAFAAPMLNLGRCRLQAAAPHEYSIRAIDAVGRSLVIDMLGLLSLDWRKVSAWHQRPASFDTADFQRLRDSGIDVFHPAVDLNQAEPYSATQTWLKRWHGFLNARPDQFLPVFRAGDLTAAKEEKKIGVLLGMQNSNHFRTPGDVDKFYSLGQRLSQLTYNARNRIGFGCIERKDAGLTELGFQIIERMNAVGMVVDVSHVGDQTSLDAFAASSKPVLVTHSNCRALMPHPRCKSDEVIRAMAKTGGVMGITGVRAFVSRRTDASVEDVLDHFDHVIRVAGIEHVGIGSDSDLGDTARRIDVAGLNHARRIFDLAEGFVRRGYTDTDIELILGANFKRALDDIFTSSV